jgi:hypothetical protein
MAGKIEYIKGKLQFSAGNTFFVVLHQTAKKFRAFFINLPDIRRA